VRLPQAQWFKQKDVNDIYWFSVVAVFKDQEPRYQWGWTNHEHVFNDDAVTGSFDSAAGTWDWSELYDQLGNSEDMSFVLFTEPGCFPCAHPDYDEWLSVGKPDCCHGDADGLLQGDPKTGYYYVGAGDLNVLIGAWQVLEPAVAPTPSGPGIGSVPGGICADFDHAQQGDPKTGYYRVGAGDLNILILNWQVLEPAVAPTPSGPGIPPDCLDCP
jgi:hypothetical protein